MSTDRIENLKYIVRTLLSEQGGNPTSELPNDLGELQQTMRALQNVRPPMPVTDDFLRAQDAELQQQRQDKGEVEIADIAPSKKDMRLRLWQGDITRLRVDAIVNAANSALLGCFSPLHSCIDNVIHSAAGVQLRLECDRLMQEQGHPEPTGRAKITGGYNLLALHVIHTVGPIIRGIVATLGQEQELASCYKNCLALADASGLQSIAFCCISTGVFRFPQRRAAEIAVSTTRAYLDATPGTNINTVIFNVFKDADLDIYNKLLQ